MRASPGGSWGVPGCIAFAAAALAVARDGSRRARVSHSAHWPLAVHSSCPRWVSTFSGWPSLPHLDAAIMQLQERMENQPGPSITPAPAIAAPMIDESVIEGVTNRNPCCRPAVTPPVTSAPRECCGAARASSWIVTRGIWGVNLHNLCAHPAVHLSCHASPVETGRGAGAAEVFPGPLAVLRRRALSSNRPRSPRAGAAGVTEA